jgi:hypothetical protein
LRPYLENTQHQKTRAAGVTQVIESLSSKHEALSSIPSTARKKNKNKNKKTFTGLK